MSKKRQEQSRRTETQHYVSQFYLRGFTGSGSMMFCYDKVADRSHPISTEAAAQERYFYEIPPRAFEDQSLSVPLNAVEKALAVVEKHWAPLHAELIKSADEGRINAELTFEYTPFLAMQWMRTKTFRDMIHEHDRRLMQSIADDLVKLNFAGKQPPKVTLGDQGLAAMHARAILDPEVVDRISDCLLRHYWVVGINNTEHLFYTSDHPVVRRGNQVHKGRRLLGFRDPGIEVAFPLDSRHILLVLERTHFADWQKYNNRSVQLSADQVRDYSSLQVMRSNQRVFCADDDFFLAREVCVGHPESRDPHRPRVRVVTTPFVSVGLNEDGNEELVNNTILIELE